MAISNNSFNVSQKNYSLQMQNQVKDAGKNAAQTNVARGDTGVSKQQGDSNKGVKEKSLLSEAAQKALEQADLKKTQEQGGAQNAQKASGQKKAKEREKTKGGDGDIRGGGERNYQPGDLSPTATGNFVVRGESEEEDFEITGVQAKRLGELDSPKHAKEKILGEMPEHVRKASENMVTEKTDTEKKRDKHADLKDGPKAFGDQVEGVILEPAESFKEAGTRPAALQSAKQEKPMQVEDTHSEDIVKNNAKEQLAKGGAPDEAFVA